MSARKASNRVEASKPVTSSGYGRIKRVTKPASASNAPSYPAPKKPDEQEIAKARKESAASKIQRAYRRWKKNSLMRMAAQAIKDSERIYLDR